MGVHLGHARIIDRLVHLAHANGGPAIAFTFDPHPAAILRPDQVPPPLTKTERKAELLGRLGVDAVVAYPTEPEFLELTARDFFDRILVDALDARAIVEGPNFFFGHDRRGNVEVLRQ
jgi:riboflavin kinase/FMN adenylyltransferase